MENGLLDTGLSSTNSQLSTSTGGTIEKPRPLKTSPNATQKPYPNKTAPISLSCLLGSHGGLEAEMPNQVLCSWALLRDRSIGGSAYRPSRSGRVGLRGRRGGMAQELCRRGRWPQVVSSQDQNDISTQRAPRMTKDDHLISGYREVRILSYSCNQHGCNHLRQGLTLCSRPPSSHPCALLQEGSVAT